MSEEALSPAKSMPLPILQPQPKSAWLVFSGGIDNQSVGRILHAMCLATQSGNYTDVHLLFQSAGGIFGDGVCLYNFFKAYTLPLTIYNAGAVQSAAAIAFLGATSRKTSRHGSFMIHRTVSPAISVTSDRLSAMTGSLVADDARMEAILQAHVTLTAEQWAVHHASDLFLTADEAVTAGIATLGDFAPPAREQIYNL